MHMASIITFTAIFIESVFKKKFDRKHTAIDDYIHAFNQFEVYRITYYENIEHDRNEGNKTTQ